MKRVEQLAKPERPRVKRLLKRYVRRARRRAERRDLEGAPTKSPYGGYSR